MRKNRTYQVRPQNLKQRLMSALSMLLIAAILMTSATLAWFVMSTAPEVTGITTNVGANGSLEIALLNADTYSNLNAIRASVGTSMVNRNPAANNAWGNLVDLGYQEYGLEDLLLLPSRLMVSKTGTNYIVDSNLLAVPVYGYDGRIVQLESNTVTAIYQDGEFARTNVQDYGVRAVGTANGLSPQGDAMSQAKSSIPAHTTTAKNKAESSLGDNLESLMGVAMNRNGTFEDGDLQFLQSMINSLDESLNAVRSALRHGLIAYAASEISDQDTFLTVRDQINTTDLSDLLTLADGTFTVPDAFSHWITELDVMENKLNAAKIALSLLNDGAYTDDEIQDVLGNLLDMNGAWINVDGTDKPLSSLNSDDVSVLMNADSVDIMLRADSGIYSSLADFTGNYSASANVLGRVLVKISTTSSVEAYLAVLNTGVQELTPADGGDETTMIPLDSTYGYAIDLAFRCNAENPDLLLQTSAIQRVYTDSEAASTQGGGSYMAFSTKDQSLTHDRQLALMDALRVAFVDAQGTIMAVAKPNVTNADVEEGVLKAPLYLYDFTFEPDETGELLISFGERRKTDNLITKLDRNVPKAVTAIVWLDGDIVDNTMVSASEVASLNGVLNLQFSTSAKLVPGEEAHLFDYKSDLSPLRILLDPTYEEYNTELDCVNTYNTGKTNKTTVSWNNFAEAYDRALFLYNSGASDVQAREAAVALAEALQALEPISKEAIDSKITELRQLMGSTEEISGFVVDDELVTSFTQEEFESLKANNAVTIYSVDYLNNNLSTEEGIEAPRYTDGTWKDLASALYYAEYINKKEVVTSEELDQALTQLENAQKALEHQVAFVPYEYKEKIYYKVAAAHDDNLSDVYGDWYDADFNRIYSEVMMMTLDGYAEPVTVMAVNGSTYLQYGKEETKYVTINAELLSTIYPELEGAQVKGIAWDPVDSYYFTEMMSSRHYAMLSKLVELIKEEGLDQLSKYAVDTAKAEQMMLAYISFNAGNDDQYTAAEVTAQIAELEALMEQAREYQATRKDAVATETQKTLLNKAIITAETFVTENKDNTDAEMQTKVQAMETAVAEAKAVIEKEDMNYGEAMTALKKLNKALTAAGLPQVNEYNTIIHVIPGPAGSESFVYDSNYTDLVLKVYNSGTTTLKATILTEDGLVDHASKEITIYDAADGLKCFGENRVEYSGLNPIHIRPGETMNLSADIYYKQDLPGVVDKFWKDPSLLVRETVVEYLWASEDPRIVSIDENGKLTAVGGGITNFSVSVKTQQGNSYAVINIPVLVYTPADGLACYNGETEITVAEGIDMNTGDSITLTPVLKYAEDVLDADRETIESCDWEFDPYILKIDTNGTVTALTGGDTTISMTVHTVQGHTYELKDIPIRIPFVKAEGAKFFNGQTEIIAADGLDLNAGSSYHLSAQLLYADDVEEVLREGIKYYTWEDYNMNMLQPDASGNLYVVSGGETTLTMEAHTIQGNVYKIENIPVRIPYEEADGVKVYYNGEEPGTDPIELYEGESIRLSPELFYESSVPDNLRESILTYSCTADNNQAVTLDYDGDIIVTALSGGQTILTVTVDTVQGNTYDYTVYNVIVHSGTSLETSETMINSVDALINATDPAIIEQNEEEFDRLRDLQAELRTLVEAANGQSNVKARERYLVSLELVEQYNICMDLAGL